MTNWAQDHRFVLAVTVAALFLFIFIAASNGLIQQDLGGEEFAVYHNANSFDHLTAWRNYFFEVGRPVAVAYWIYSFELIGYNPLLLHFLSFILLLTASIFGAYCFWAAWPTKYKSPWIPSLLTILFFFNWISMSTVFKVAGDQIHLTLIFFFLSGITLQKWARSDTRLGWLFLSLLLFLVSLFTYENIAFIYPALVILAWAQANERKQIAWRNFLWIAALSLGFIVFPYLVYQQIGLITSGDVYRAGLSSPQDPAHLLNLLEMIVRFGSGFTFGEPFSSILAVGIFCFALIFVERQLVLYTRNGNVNAHHVAITLSSLMFLIFGLFPYVIAGYQVTDRVFSSAIFGLPPLLLLAFQTKKTQWIRLLGIVCLLAFAYLGVSQFRARSFEQTSKEPERNTFYLGMKQIIPSVKSGTVFIFINYPLSNNGCGPSFNMLYDRTGIQCAFFSSTIPEYRAYRYTDNVSANRGGHLRTENWILISVDDLGNPTIIDEIREGDYGLLISWIDDKPIHTDYRRIEDEAGRPSLMYLDLLRRREALSFEFE